MAQSDGGPAMPTGGGHRSAASAGRRSLRAVFAADVVGFSGRMSLNETSTVNLLSEIRTIARQALERYNGWLFGMPGDGLFATFESAIGAVQCALEVQQALAARADLSELPLRIGIHLGEVLINDGLPFGETLNIAARLEALAEPGGILVSGPVMDAVSSRVSATFEDRGIPHLKNIPRRLPTYAVKPPPTRTQLDSSAPGNSNLDHTTRLDRDALRELLGEQTLTEIDIRSDGFAGDPAEPATTAPPNLADVANPAPPPSQPQEAPAPIATAPQPSRDIEPPTAETAAPNAATNNAPEIEPAQQQPAAFEPTQAPPAIAARRPTLAFLDEITRALAEHIGPLAKIIVDREMKSNPTVFDLITRLEQHVPMDAERLRFRVRASHINAKMSTTRDRSD